MVVLIVVGALVVLVLALWFLTRDRELPVKCCNPAPWPPTDIDARHAEHPIAAAGPESTGAHPESEALRPT